MKRFAVLFSLLFAFAAAAELPVGEQVIHTKDGRELRGVVVSQTEQGYLLKMANRTELVPFAVIQDMLPAEGPGPAPVTPPPPPPPAAAPPGYETLPPPPPPAAVPAPDAPPEAEAQAPDWRADRKGFHWTLGAGGMVDPGIIGGGSSGVAPPVAGYVGGFAAVRWGFGWLDVQVELMPLGYFRGATKMFIAALNPQLRINFARFYSLGVGVWGGVTIVPSVDFVLGPSFSPAIFRLGDLGQHEIRFWVAAPALATTPGLRSGTVLLLLLSYAYVF